MAGAINAAAGGGTLLVFPVLVALGLPALTANLTTTVALCPGHFTIVHGYRRELKTQRTRIAALLPPALLGGAAGIAALELAPPEVFQALAPALVLIACGLLAVQPQISTRLSRAAGRNTWRGAHAAVGMASAYAAYFGAGAGVLLLAVLAICVDDQLQRLNALNRLLILVINVVAAIVFAVVGPINWSAVAALAVGTSIGGIAGVRVVRELRPSVLRMLVISVGLVATGYLITVSW